MNERSHESSVGTYILIALILGAVTYMEFGLVEYPQAWLGATWTIIVLATLSVAKFILVIMFFMHLKDDEATYSGFFSSGMVIALGTFIALTVLFLAPRSVALVRSELAATHDDTAASGEAALPEEAGGLSQATLEDIRTNGYNRPLTAISDDPPPKDQAVPLPAPRAALDGSSYQVKLAAPLLGNAAASGVPAGGAASNAAPGASSGASPSTGAGSGAASGSAPAGPSAQAAASWDEALGTKTFNTNCMACHQGNGQGIAGAFPPLAGHLPDLYNAEGGRGYLIHTVLYGMQGQITVLGQSYNGAMPGWGQLSNEQIASVLNHELTSWGNDADLQDFSPIQPDEVASARGGGLSAQDVYGIRKGLALP